MLVRASCTVCTSLWRGGGLLGSLEPRSGEYPVRAARARRAVPPPEQVGDGGIDFLEGGDLEENFKS